MKVVFSIGENFNQLLDATALQRNCNAFANAFPSGVRTEFFYYLKATETQRYFMIRSDTTDREIFIRQANDFAENLGFGILGKIESRELLERIDLDLFV